METEIITLHNRHKIYNFILIVSSIAAMLSAVQDDRGRPLPAVRSIELIVHNFRRKSSNVCLFLLGNSLMCLRADYLLDSRRFSSKFYLQNSTYFHITFHCIIIMHEITQ